MFTKTVRVEIEIPVTFQFDPGSPASFYDPGAKREIYDIDFQIEDVESAVRSALEDVEILEELEEYAKSEIERERMEGKHGYL